jgi:hypothetical protein
MGLAVGVPSADPVFVTVIIHFQVVGHLSTALAITQHGHVWRMLKLEELHALGWLDLRQLLKLCENLNSGGVRPADGNHFAQRSLA